MDEDPPQKPVLHYQAPRRQNQLTPLERLLRQAENGQMARGLAFLICLVLALLILAGWIWR